MTLIALGINHNTASVEVREAVAFSPEQMTAALRAAVAAVGIKEVAILSTCNRTEVYADTGGGDVGHAELLQWMAEYHNTGYSALEACHYAHEGVEAARHMMKVASGLDSLVLGEPQILGQMKSAYATANDAGSLGSGLHSAFHKVFSVAKRVRSETAIGENPVSVAYAAVSLAQQIFSDLKNDTALLIGAGETIELVARHLVEQGLKHIIVANRTLTNASKLAQQFNGEAILLTDIPDHLHKADIVISSTASPLPVLGKGTVESALKKRRHKPIFMVDIAVPRDIESQVGDLADVYLYTVDDLKEVIDENMRSREQAAQIAAEIIDEGVIRYQQELNSLDAVATVKAYRSVVDELREAELAKAIKTLQAGSDPADVLNQLARNLCNKLMHTPTAQLRKASADGDFDVINTFQTLFDLDVGDPNKPAQGSEDQNSETP
ncbi:glutamyl-tRNA reductase [Marinagarivorans cellulosilyticus]|uniref:Glutamyl-tRNA reductase n=1 Tax=Marinagarivorans cellulosilyticus TaxID=2721545 RepID=A0AAN1WEF8_9GAMM|nr:glutamyl-tRNA reductase [Marinagarivorans cellulosilyticus]BCD96086.1 glutamyl-tRNA reductase [Marinagarivorans cellulosilyticus]